MNINESVEQTGIENIEKRIALIGNLDAPIEEMYFGDLKVCNALKRNGIFTIKQFLQISISELKVAKGVGKKTIDTIKEKLLKMGCCIPEKEQLPLYTELSSEKVKQDILNLSIVQTEKERLLEQLEEVIKKSERKETEKIQHVKGNTDVVLSKSIEDLKSVYKQMQCRIQDLNDEISRIIEIEELRRCSQQPPEKSLRDRSEALRKLRQKKKELKLVLRGKAAAETRLKELGEL